MCICDTCVLIDYLRDKSDTVERLHFELDKGLSMSAVTYMELMIGAFNKTEIRMIKKTFSNFKIIEIDEEISFAARMLTEKFSKSHGLLLPDALIAATSLLTNIPLWTENTRDFRFIPGIKLAFI